MRGIRFEVISILFIAYYLQRLETFVPLQLKTAAPKINDFKTKNPSALYPTSPRQNRCFSGYDFGIDRRF